MPTDKDDKDTQETALDSVLLLESEKADGYYWAFDTKELTRGSMKERYEAYEIAVRNHILQVDEVRREEDYEPLGFNFVTLGLSDVLLDPESMEVFIPNTGQSVNLNEPSATLNVGDEERAQWIKGEHGYFAGSISTGGSGGGKSAKGVDNSGENGIILLGDSGELLYSVTEQSLSAIPRISAFDDERINRAIESQCRRILESVQNDPVGTECTVSIRLSDLHSEMQKGKPGAGTVLPIHMNEPYISIHNHASNETISARDARILALRDECHAIAVIGNKGNKLYILQKTEEFQSKKFFDAIQDKIKPENSHISDDEFLMESERYGTKYFR